MAKATSQNIIELNGKRYDAVSGRELSKEPARDSSSVHHGRGRMIDGFSAPRNTAPAQPVAIKPPIEDLKPKPVNHVNLAGAQRIPHQKARAAIAHQQQSSETLMRQTVKRPDIQKKPALKTQNTTDLAQKTPSLIVPKHSYYQTDKRLMNHAEQVAQSRHISHFSRPTAPVRPAETARQAQPVSIAPPKPAQPVTKPVLPEDNDQDIFEHALAIAKSHEAKPIKRTKRQAMRAHRRTAGVGASVLVVLVLGLFIAYQNRANINLQLASAKAGFHATEPSYQPSGYKLGSLRASPGTVSINYHAPTGNDINISQKESNWDSETLQQNFVATNDQSYRTHHIAGQTIFTFDHNATWVDGGIWYQIEGNASTTDQQLVHIAASM